MERAILLVDDEEDIRDVLNVSLVDAGYRVFPAENGEKALELFHRHHPPVVVSDIKMPGMDGIELLRRIKLESPDTEFIMITGHGDMELAVVSFKDQASDFITKPINIDVLEIALNKVFEKIVSRRQLREYTESLERLIREKTELQSNLAALGLMIGSISHGMKGLLTGLDGGIYLMESGLKRNQAEQVDDGLKTVRLMAERIRKMVLDILYHAKERKLNRERVNILQFAEDTASTIEVKMKEHGIDLLRNFDASGGYAEIDWESMHSALMNILENAMDACIRDVSKPSHQVVFGVRPDGNDVRFDITDNGTGMDRETRDKLFTLFFSSKGCKGTGLGLFVSNQIVRQHDGSIAVSSTPGHGSTFTVRIPGMMTE
jgi:signal transduction histidine kinase